MESNEIKAILYWICTQKMDTKSLNKIHRDNIEKGMSLVKKFNKSDIKNAFLTTLKELSARDASIAMDLYSCKKLREVCTKYELKEHRVQIMKHEFSQNFYKNLKNVQK